MLQVVEDMEKTGAGVASVSPEDGRLLRLFIEATGAKFRQAQGHRSYGPGGALVEALQKEPQEGRVAQDVLDGLGRLAGLGRSPLGGFTFLTRICRAFNPCDGRSTG